MKANTTPTAPITPVAQSGQNGRPVASARSSIFSSAFFASTLFSTTVGLLTLLAGTAGAQAEQAEQPAQTTPAVTVSQPATEPGIAGPNKPTFWGAGVGLIFSSIPISEADFVSPFTQIYYSWYVTDPNASFRTALSMGLYGFGMILPVPKASAEMFFGSPDRDVQGKVGVGGFYDIAVGGHGGVYVEPGVRIANRYDISFVIVPTGSDSKRDYLEFIGMRTKEESKKRKDAGKANVVLPYFGTFVSVAF